jgi:hypothetical protein
VYTASPPLCKLILNLSKPVGWVGLANSFESKGAPLFSYSCVWDFQANQNIITHSLTHSLHEPSCSTKVSCCLGDSVGLTLFLQRVSWGVLCLQFVCLDDTAERTLRFCLRVGFSIHPPFRTDERFQTSSSRDRDIGRTPVFLFYRQTPRNPTTTATVDSNHSPPRPRDAQILVRCQVPVPTII